MRERLPGFVSGHLYNFQNVVPPERGQFLWFDHRPVLASSHLGLRTSLLGRKVLENTVSALQMLCLAHRDSGGQG
jgi:hypothetical protein